MNILDEIVAHKRKEVAERRDFYSEKLLEQSVYFEMPCISMVQRLMAGDKAGIIAEIKRKSPSKGVINMNISIETTSRGYVKAGASALSILTDNHFFGGSSMDLTEARIFNNRCPILRKEFIVEEYQVMEAKAIGADVILLIAAALSAPRLKELCRYAHGLGLEVLLEIHDEKELLENLEAGADLLGVNNRDLKTFKLNVETSMQLADLIPDTLVKVSESGIESPEVIIKLKQYGFRGFLMGQTFMLNARPDLAAEEFINALRLAESLPLEAKR